MQPLILLKLYIKVAKCDRELIIVPLGQISSKSVFAPLFPCTYMATHVAM